MCMQQRCCCCVAAGPTLLMQQQLLVQRYGDQLGPKNARTVTTTEAVWPAFALFSPSFLSEPLKQPVFLGANLGEACNLTEAERGCEPQHLRWQQQEGLPGCGSYHRSAAQAGKRKRASVHRLLSPPDRTVAKQVTERWPAWPLHERFSQESHVPT
jgi:hypothetical protein